MDEKIYDGCVNVGKLQRLIYPKANREKQTDLLARVDIKPLFVLRTGNGFSAFISPADSVMLKRRLNEESEAAEHEAFRKKAKRAPGYSPESHPQSPQNSIELRLDEITVQLSTIRLQLKSALTELTKIKERDINKEVDEVLKLTVVQS